MAKALGLMFPTFFIRKTGMCTRMAHTVSRSPKELAYFSSGVLAAHTMLCVDGNAEKALLFPPTMRFHGGH